ncbi:MAG: hypothetical protein K8T26_06115 [Lentisphaerae bacterium]|nr:hypothetical protein [Lentisphaerota bacterium]
MKRYAFIGSLALAVVILSGCAKKDLTPRFAGRIVSHVDTYGSGTGGQSELKPDGSMRSGFKYGDPAKPDWTSDIKWRLIRQRGEADLYRVEWTFTLRNTAGNTKAAEVPFDGRKSVLVFSNQWQVVSIEPGMTKEDSQQAARHVR